MSEDLLNKSIEYAKILTLDVKRANGESYFDHSLKIKKYLEDIGIRDEIILASAILHGMKSANVIDDAEIKKEFGEEISSLTCQLDSISKIRLNSKIKNSQELHKLYIQLSSDIRVLLIRLADRIENMKTSEIFDNAKRLDLADKALSVYAPVSYACGIYSFTKEFQNEALKIIDPDVYSRINKWIKKRFDYTREDLNQLKAEIEEHLRENNIEHKITYRTKSVYSVYQKINRKYPGDIEESKINQISDLVGIRILVPSVDECYSVLAFLQKKWEMILEEYDDYIKNPKPNGYQTLQTAFALNKKVRCEVQIRTFEMHEKNEFGNASHFQYKYGRSRNNDAYWVKTLINMKDEILNKISNNKTNIGLFEDTIFVFTPKGDLITLPKGSTPVDFAYAVHTDIGNHCTGAKVNDRMTKLNSILKSGDSIEILTNKSSRPSINWLRFVKTRIARQKIKGLHNA